MQAESLLPHLKDELHVTAFFSFSSSSYFSVHMHKFGFGQFDNWNSACMVTFTADLSRTE